MRGAIHQPNFMPWLGFFHRLSTVERYVVFDHVQAMGGRSWLSRNRILVGGAAHWLTLPVHKSGRFGQTIREVEIDYTGGIARKHLRTLELSYKNSPHSAPVLDMLNILYKAEHRFIADFNCEFIRGICNILGLNVELFSSSDLVRRDPELAAASGNDLVLQICLATGVTSYVSGEGCLDFIQPDAFERQGIAFYFQNFEHPVYRQQGARDFMSHLSIVDALSNLGAAGVQNLIRRADLRRPCPPAAKHLMAVPRV